MAGEEKIRGGIAKRYRYEPTREREPSGVYPPSGFIQTLADELVRRTETGRWQAPKVIGDADIWIDPQQWDVLRTKVSDLVRELHLVAQPPRSPGAIRTSTTVAMFELESE